MTTQNEEVFNGDFDFPSSEALAYYASVEPSATDPKDIISKRTLKDVFEELDAKAKV